MHGVTQTSSHCPEMHAEPPMHHVKCFLTDVASGSGRLQSTTTQPRGKQDPRHGQAHASKFVCSTPKLFCCASPTGWMSSHVGDVPNKGDVSETAAACNLRTCSQQFRNLATCNLAAYKWPTTSQPATWQPPVAPLKKTSPATCIHELLVMAMLLNMSHSGFSLADSCCPSLFGRPGHLFCLVNHVRPGLQQTRSPDLSPTSCNKNGRAEKARRESAVGPQHSAKPRPRTSTNRKPVEKTR